MYPFIIVIDEPAELYGMEAGFANETSVKEFEQSRASAVMIIKSLSNVIKGRAPAG